MLRIRIFWLCLLSVLIGCEPSSRSDSAANRDSPGQPPPVPEPDIAAAGVNEADTNRAKYFRGQAAREQEDFAGALKHFLEIQRDGSLWSVQAAIAMAEIEVVQGRIGAAIENYRWAVRLRPEDDKLRSTLAQLYSATEQRVALDQLLAATLRHRHISFKELILLTDFDRRDPEQMRFLEKSRQSSPDDAAVNLGLATVDLQQRDRLSARQRLESAVRSKPELAAAQGLLGEILAADAPNQMTAWHDQLPHSIQTAPEIWLARGLWAQSEGDRRVAVRCFWEAARQVPTSYRVLYQLGTALSEVDPKLAFPYRDRARQTFELRQNLSELLNSGGSHERAGQQVVELLVASGRRLEAWHWLPLLNERFPGRSWLQEKNVQLADCARNSTARLPLDQNVAEVYRLDHYPEFETFLKARAAGMPSVSADPSTLASSIRLIDEAQAVNFQFEFHEGNPEQDGVRMFESTGGGLGVIDFDHDGWPDLFCTQGELWRPGQPEPSPSPIYRDILYRNHRAEFRNVSVAAFNYPDNGFGQGCAVGDINSDGFADLYVANIGRNALLINQGDGTFLEQIVSGGLDDQRWTTSCAIADLNGDGHPDLLDVNYLEGPDVFTATCHEHECSTLPFQGSRDDFLISRGDGTFQRLQRAEEKQSGPGLGVIIMNLGALLVNPKSPEVEFTKFPLGSIFIGNDGQPDYLLTVSVPDQSSQLQFSDSGFASGVAVNALGRHTSSMGIGAGDLDGDGRLDLLVTNYRGEANTLLLQQPDGFFLDATAGSGLYAPGLPMVGWGTQFADLDCDGRLDIVIANGHVADFGRPDVEYAMPIQVFQQLDSLQFRLLPAGEVGDVAAHLLLARGVVRWDWNCDGQIDFAVGSIGSPYLLLSNHSQHVNSFFGVRLHGWSGNRDAVGAVATITTESGSQTAQLIAGDGYHASNQKLLHFGVGTAEKIGRLSIVWPRGSVQVFENLPVNTIVDVVENRDFVTTADHQH